ncbi:MAG: hypothetical protein RMH77_07530, partial [Sulfolobales archaeon]|nr:hypothetical protein [Sulfolobales archaeon]
IQKPLPEKKIAEWDISAMEPGEIIRRAFSILRHAGIGHPPDHIKPPPPDGIPLTKISPKLKEKLSYKVIRFPDGKRSPLKYWRDILTAAVEWLVSSNRLMQPPIKTSEGFTYLVNSVPRHENGKPFRSKREVSGLWVETNFNNKDVVKHTKRLLEMHGISPETVFLHK